MNTPEVRDNEYAILDSVYHAGERNVRQRDLAQAVGISLGMTNVILKKLAHKGWLAVRKVSNRNMHYAVTPAGIEAISRRSLRFLKRTVRNVVYYKDVLEAFLVEVQRQGYKGIALHGKSDFDFILEHLSRTHGLLFRQTEDMALEAGWLRLYSENRKGGGDARAGHVHSQSAWLQEILIGP